MILSPMPNKKKEITLHDVMSHIGKMKFDLEKKMEIKFKQMDDKMDRKFAIIDKRFERIDRRFEQIDRRFDNVDRAFDRLYENRLNDLKDVEMIKRHVGFAV